MTDEIVGWEEKAREAGVVLSEPQEDRKGILLLVSTYLGAYRDVAEVVRQRFVVVLTHWWEVDRRRLREYRRLASLIDCVASPCPAMDRQFDFAPVFRSNSMDLVVDDTLWPNLGLERDIDVVDSVSVPWRHKRPLKWLKEVRRVSDRRGHPVRAVYMAKREPNEKEDRACHREYARFRERLLDTPGVELRLNASQHDVVRLYNRAKVINKPSTTDFGPRCVLEAMYCGARPVLGVHGWVQTVTASPDVFREVRQQRTLRSFPLEPMPEIRQWVTARGVRQRLVDFLSERHSVNREFLSFTMFSHQQVTAISAADYRQAQEG